MKYFCCDFSARASVLTQYILISGDFMCLLYGSEVHNCPGRSAKTANSCRTCCTTQKDHHCATFSLRYLPALLNFPQARYTSSQYNHKKKRSPYSEKQNHPTSQWAKIIDITTVKTVKNVDTYLR